MRPEDLASCHAMSLLLAAPAGRLAVPPSGQQQLGGRTGTARWHAQRGRQRHALPLGEDYATLGLVIIADALQGRGLGRAMMQRLLQDAGTRNVILNATEAGRPLYEKLGFVVTDTLSQHQSTTAHATPELAAGERIRALRKDELPFLLALDRQASGMDRSALLVPLLDTSEVAVLEQGGQVKGVAYLREFGRGRVIGPVIASHVEDAKKLIAYWINAIRALTCASTCRAAPASNPGWRRSA
jgi:GNAT superfamily N-acetyltransferase